MHVSLFGVIIMRVSYGSGLDRAYIQELVLNIEEFLRGYFEYLTPGRVLVSSFPILRHVPSWFPGAGWKRELYKLRDLGQKIIQTPWNDAKDRVVSTSHYLQCLIQFYGHIL